MIYESTFDVDFIKKGIAIGLNKLFECTLPSIWTNSGVGWQQLWDVSDNAGFYASCEGIILLLAIPEFYDLYEEAKSLAAKVFSEHVVLVVDDNVMSFTEAHERMRYHTLNTVMKIAKFVQAANKINDSVGLTQEQERVLNIQKKRLQDIGLIQNGKWSCTFMGSNDEAWSLAAVPESIIALYESGDGNLECIRSSLGLLLDEIRDNYNIFVGGDFRRESIILWVLSEVCEVLSEVDLMFATGVAKRNLMNGYHQINAHWDDRFRNPYTGFDDYYTYNTMILANIAMMNFIEKDQMPLSAIDSCLPIVYRMADNIIKNISYKDPSSGKRYFWEHCQALGLLVKFYGLFEAKKLDKIYKEAFMYVNPMHFNKKTFVVDETSAVVIMPFGPKWSKVVFSAIQESCSSQGISAWRSDMDYGDDHIMQSIWERINSAKFIVADCTHKNPNVFYELGIAHTIGKPVFICAQKRDDIPFDLGHIRSYVYGEMNGEVDEILSNIESFKIAIRHFIQTI